MDNNLQIAQASVKMQRISPRKARLVADLFRGKDLRNALGILKHTNKKAAALFIKLLNSAVANATNNHGLDASKLYVKEVLVNEGPTLKRYQPHSQGRAYSILKRTSHLSITLAESESFIANQRKIAKAKRVTTQVAEAKTKKATKTKKEDK